MKKKELDPLELVKTDSVTDANLAWEYRIRLRYISHFFLVNQSTFAMKVG
jgi:hypothetical protein